LGRYLYDLDGNWVDLDERKQPLSRPRLPDWALPMRKPVAIGHQNGHNHTKGNGNLKPQYSEYVEQSSLSYPKRIDVEIPSTKGGIEVEFDDIEIRNVAK
jgi:hypothetical protein